VTRSIAAKSGGQWISSPGGRDVQEVLHGEGLDVLRRSGIAPAVGDSPSMLTLMTALVLRGPQPKDDAA
jgi:hypothetical protein